MIAAIKAEFRKLLSVRSTYFITVLAFIFLAFISLYVESFVNGKRDVKADGATFLASSIMQHASILAVFGAIVALLLLAHEYRYNTVLYTLTSSNSRTKVLLAKIITVMAYALVLSVVGMFVGLALERLGLHWAHVSLPHQNLSLLNYFAKMLFYCEGYALAALLFVGLLRNQVAAIVVLFLEPSTFEGLLSLLFKHNSVYMPFMALSQVIAVPTGDITRHRIISATGYLSAPRGALVFAAYLVGGCIIAWILFLRRDAN
jgi:ABC-type transport system involved in multi-copper enzyme maturation permease subunit